LQQFRRIRVNVTLTTLLPPVARILEGRSPSPHRRLHTIRRLTEAGIPTSVFVMPIVPGVTDHPEDLYRLLRAARRAGAGDAAGGLLRLEPGARRAFQPILERNFPHLIELYRRIYDDAPNGAAAVRRRVEADFAEARSRAGFAEQPGPGARAGVPATGEQLELGL